VKASRSGSWQFGDVSKFFAVAFEGKKQNTGRVKKSPVQRLLVAFVVVDESGNDRFYILSWEQLRDILRKKHRSNIAKHKGVRPKKRDSLHAVILEDNLRSLRDNWKLIERNLQ
jgi:hypothetical protein